MAQLRKAAREVDLDAPALDVFGEPISLKDQPQTVGQLIVRAIAVHREADARKTEAEKVRLHRLARRLSRGGVQTVTCIEVRLILERCDIYGVNVLGLIEETLNS